MDPHFEYQLGLTRRQFFGTSGLRLGGLALGMLMANQGSRAQQPARVHPPLPELRHFPPRANSLIYLHMNGGRAQMDLWDYKPQLQAYFDRDLPASIRRGQRITTMTSGQGRLPVAPSRFAFQRSGKSGIW